MPATANVPTVTPQEEAVLSKLGEVWNEYLKLDSLHSNDEEEFRRAIHAAQNIVLARTAMRLMKHNKLG